MKKAGLRVSGPAFKEVWTRGSLLAIQGVPACSGEEEGDVAAQVDEGQFAAARAGKGALMSNEKRYGHGDDKEEGGEAGKQAQHEQDRANELSEDGHAEAGLRADSKWVRELGGHLSETFRFGESMEEKHAKAKPETESEEAKAGVGREELEFKELHRESD